MGKNKMYGHVLRMNEDRILKTILNVKQQEWRTWEETEEDLQEDADGWRGLDVRLTTISWNILGRRKTDSMTIIKWSSAEKYIMKPC
jgi:hypothetical protein